MKRSELEIRLLASMRGEGRVATGIGIDLGTTKSSLAIARFDRDSGRVQCECVRYPQSDDIDRIGVPSAVGWNNGHCVFGVDALALRQQPGKRNERDFFYETKNLMGLRYTFARAPLGLRTPTEVAAQIVRQLHQRSPEAMRAAAAEPAVVAVPASFHGTQRIATLHAARLGLGCAERTSSVRLIDEPYAAFIDLKFRAPERAQALLRDGANVMVFDFGGGTCDVAIFRVDAVRGGTLGARLLGTSRYHRLGGGDIDRAIVHDVLIPDLLAQNGIAPFALSWHDKRHALEPQLMDLAERLKLALSNSLASHAAAGLAVAADQSVAAVDQRIHLPGSDRTLLLRAPCLSAAQFNELLEPFLDREPPPEAGDEYVQRSSLFAPVLQALMRARLEPEDLHGVLLCGSSSLLPQVQQALAAYLPDAQQVLLGDAEALQGAVARGAALQALALQVLGEPLIAPVCSAELSLRVVSGMLPLMRAGDPVPGQSAAATLLRPPRDSLDQACEIAVELVADGNRGVGRSLWMLPPPVSSADRLSLEWTLDENQCLELRLNRIDHPDTEPFVRRFDAPIMHRDAGQVVRGRLLEREEAIRNDEIPREQLGDAFEQQARDCACIGEFEKALHFLSLALQEKGESRALMNLRGIYRERIGDRDGARDSYERAGEWSTTRFNLALLHKRNGRLSEALAAVDSALELEPSRAYRTLRGDILQQLGKRAEARIEWQDALSGEPDWSEFDDFELGWLESAARALDQRSTLQRIREERDQQRHRVEKRMLQGELPELTGARQSG